MKLSEIRQMPNVVMNNHESVMRCYHVLEKVVYMVKLDTPKEVILEIVDDLMHAPEVEKC